MLMGPTETPAAFVGNVVQAIDAYGSGAPEALFPAGSPCDRLDQLADVVHDEGDLRAVPATVSYTHLTLPTTERV